MIFVAVGTQKFQLNRLLRQLDKLIEAGKIQDKVFAQTGHSDYKPVNYEYTDFLSKEEFDEYISRSSMLITHSGVGTIIAGMKHKKPIIVFPRLAKFGEHVDDHQLQIAESFSEQNFVLLCNNESELLRMMNRARKTEFSVYQSQRQNVLKAVRDFLED